MNELLDPRNDFLFKRIFGSKDNRDVLLAFLNKTSIEAGRPPLTEIILLNPYNEKDTPRDKQSILDIRGKLRRVNSLTLKCSCSTNMIPRSGQCSIGASYIADNFKRVSPIRYLGNA